MSKFHFISKVIIAAIVVTFALCQCSIMESQDTYTTGNVIFIHPDGTTASMWTALRYYHYGPDSMTNWDKLDRMGMYRSHVLNSTNSSSHGGATIHVYGVKVNFDTYGGTDDTPVTALSGKQETILIEAQKAGMATALINSGHICEPGTGVFAAHATKRSNTDYISEQIINSDIDIIFSGGEILLLPEGETGRHGQPGRRKDGKNLIKLAEELGYTVIYNRDELMSLKSDVTKILGVFSPKHTFHDNPEEYNKEHNLPLYNDYAPTLAEMTQIALNILDAKGKQYIMVIEEEGTDNFANNNNAAGTLEALKRADDAVGVVTEYIDKNPNTLLIMGADSDAGGMQVYSVIKPENFDQPLPDTTYNGSPMDGIDGRGSLPFTAKPDKNGVELRFGICWAAYDDVAGGVIARAHGLNSELMGNNVDNTDIYHIMYATLFGKLLPAY